MDVEEPEVWVVTADGYDDYSGHDNAGSGVCCKINSGEAVPVEDAAAGQKRKSLLTGSGK